MLTNPKEIAEWLDSMRIKDYTIDLYGFVNVVGDVALTPATRVQKKNKLTVIPVQFGHITGSFHCKNHELVSMEGCPRTVDNHFNVSHNEITTFEHCPSYVGGAFRITYNKITSLLGVSNVLKHAREIALSKNPIEVGGIELMLIEGLTDITWGGGGTPGVMVNTMRKYLGNPNDIFACQAELIARGNERFAEF